MMLENDNNSQSVAVVPYIVLLASNNLGKILSASISRHERFVTFHISRVKPICASVIKQYNILYWPRGGDAPRLGR